MAKGILIPRKLMVQREVDELKPLRNKVYHFICYDLLSFIPDDTYSQMILGVYEYGLSSAIRDQEQGISLPEVAESNRAKEGSQKEIVRSSPRNRLYAFLCNKVFSHIATKRYISFMTDTINYGFVSVSNDIINSNDYPPNIREKENYTNDGYERIKTRN